jgi:riboflavin synthase
MFTGIVETTGTILAIEEQGTNRVFTIQSPISNELKIDQSVSHDGVCLTVTQVEADRHTVVAVQETLERSALSLWQVGRAINLERSVRLSDRLDGHLVQGHVDDTGQVLSVTSREGSWWIEIKYSIAHAALLVPKGSICINGVSLTVNEPGMDSFAVTIIPYTWEHTTFHQLREGDLVNLEFDVVGKYLARKLEVLNHVG